MERYSQSEEGCDLIQLGRVVETTALHHSIEDRLIVLIQAFEFHDCSDEVDEQPLEGIELLGLEPSAEIVHMALDLVLRYDLGLIESVIEADGGDGFDPGSVQTVEPDDAGPSEPSEEYDIVIAALQIADGDAFEAAALSKGLRILLRRSGVGTIDHYDHGCVRATMDNRTIDWKSERIG